MKLRLSIPMDQIRALDSALEELPKATQRNVLRRTLTKAAEPLRDDAKARAPERSGKLRESIIISTKLKNEAGNTAFAAAMRAGLGKDAAVKAMRDARRGNSDKTSAEVYVGSTSPLAHLTEWGSVHNEAVGWMRGAYDAHAGDAFDSIAEDLRTEIDKAVARAARKRARKAAKGG